MSTKESTRIVEIVNRETRAWDNQDIELLLSIFHPDMVWPWPPDNTSHDPESWVMQMGRFDKERWGDSWQKLFDTHRLVHNHRMIEKIEVSAENDGAYAVVDIDTLWINNHTAEKNHWKGRTCKVYTRVGGEWKLIMHTGVLDYNHIQ